ncbi:MAG TPA: tungstate ABC transporter substrate-binding protein WtpA [Tenuifilaceae bacterium]|nr:tungstate ABC transporter substrate-binding protein WtpA [Tenuifilaceae bacterium]
MRAIKCTFLFIASFFLFSCGAKEYKRFNSGELIVFHAGSLSMPMKAAVDSFTKVNPKVKVYLEAAGSVECARKISELGKPCDLFASADYKVIDKLLIPDFASWNIPFAGNEMAIVYHDKSRYANEINLSNWLDILLKDDVAFGRSDPNSDPCGYRTVMTLKLSEIYYQNAGIAEKVLQKDNKFIRPKEVDLIALLEAGAIDYIFLYKSVAVQHNLKYLSLPLEVNLSSPSYESTYRQVDVEVLGKTPNSTVKMVGEPMVYGLTILKNAPNKALAEKFVQFVLDDNGGRKILENNGQPALKLTKPEYLNKIPADIKVFLSK